MKIIVASIAAVAFLAVTGCDSKQEQARKDEIERAADLKEKQAKDVKHNAEKAADATEDIGKKQADAEADRIRREGEAKKDALKNQADAIRDQK
jgi:hypothetical protein